MQKRTLDGGFTLYQRSASQYAVRPEREPSLSQESLAAGVGMHTPPPLLYAGMLLFGLLLNRLFPLPFLPRRLSRVAGAIMVIGGQITAIASVRALRKAGNSPRPDVPVRELVEEGPYSYTRNPIYLSMTMIYTGIATIANARWAILMLPAALTEINNGMVQREESYLEERFGDRYRDYKARVRRWL